MLGTPGSRNRGRFKIFCPCTAAQSCQKSAFAADGCLLYAGRNFEISRGKFTVDSTHNVLPQSFVEAFTVIQKEFIGIISCPYCAGIIRGKSGKPHIAGSRCGTCFTGYRHIIQLQIATSTVSLVDNAFHGGSEKVGSAVAKNLFRFRFVFQKNVSILIQNFRVEHRFNVSSLVGNGRVGSSKLQCGNTGGDTSQGGRFPGIVKDLSVNDLVIGNFFKSQTFQVVVAYPPLGSGHGKPEWQ